MSKIQEIENRWAAATPGPWSDHKATKQRNDQRLHEMFQASVRVGDVNAGNTIAIVYHGGPGATSSTADAVEANAHAIANATSDVAYLLAELKRLNQAIIRTIEWAKTTGEAKEAEQYHNELQSPFNHSDEERGYARACEDVADMLGEAVRPEEAAQ